MLGAIAVPNLSIVFSKLVLRFAGRQVLTELNPALVSFTLCYSLPDRKHIRTRKLLSWFLKWCQNWTTCFSTHCNNQKNIY